jgi:hypothetical protein
LASVSACSWSSGESILVSRTLVSYVRHGGRQSLLVRDLVIVRSRQRSWEEVSGGVLLSYHIAWWKLENLFDEENALALGRRTDEVFRAIKNDIAGWTPQLRDRKIE